MRPNRVLNLGGGGVPLGGIPYIWSLFIRVYGSFPEIRGPQCRPHDTINPSCGDPENGTSNFRKSPHR